MSDLNLEKYKALKQDISRIKLKLDEIEGNKEIWFKKKEDLKKDIYSHIEKIKEIKAERDRKGAELEELRKQRDKYNDEVKELIKNIKKLNEEKADTFKKYNIKVEPSKIQQKLNELEKKVEIEVNFEKEKKLMGEIKKLKKVYEEYSEVLKIAGKASAIDKEIKESRKKADGFHRKILEITKDATYEVFIELSKKINELKSEQEAAFQKFIDHKNEYAEVNNEFKNRMEELQVFERIFSKTKEAAKLKKEERDMAIIKEKTKIVEEKIKNKKKLTTEDLLAMQGSNDFF